MKRAPKTGNHLLPLGLVVAFLILPIATVAAADPLKNPPLGAYSRCVEAGLDDPFFMDQCADIDLRNLNGNLLETVRYLFRTLPPAKLLTFKRSNAAWTAATRQKCENDPMVKENEGGTLAVMAYADCLDIETVGRITWLKRRYNIPPDVSDPANGALYGPFLLSARQGTAAEFIASEEGAPWASDFKGTLAGTPDFDAIWDLITLIEGPTFVKAQADFVQRSVYQPVLAQVALLADLPTIEITPNIADQIYLTAKTLGGTVGAPLAADTIRATLADRQQSGKSQDEIVIQSITEHRTAFLDRLVQRLAAVGETNAATFAAHITSVKVVPATESRTSFDACMTAAHADPTRLMRCGKLERLRLEEHIDNWLQAFPGPRHQHAAMIQAQRDWDIALPRHCAEKHEFQELMGGAAWDLVYEGCLLDELSSRISALEKQYLPK